MQVVAEFVEYAALITISLTFWVRAISTNGGTHCFVRSSVLAIRTSNTLIVRRRDGGQQCKESGFEEETHSEEPQETQAKLVWMIKDLQMLVFIPPKNHIFGTFRSAFGISKLSVVMFNVTLPSMGILGC